MALTATTSELAKYLNITQKQLRTLEHNGVLKRIAHNRWDPTKSAALYIRHLQETRGHSKLEEYRERHMRAKAEEAEIAVMKLKGSVAEMDVVEEAVEDVMYSFKSDLLQLPRVLSLLPLGKTPREREVTFRDKINEYLQEISAGFATIKRRSGKSTARKHSEKDNEAAA